MRLSAGPFVAGAGVQTDKTADALREFFNELAAIRKPIPAEELAKAKNYLAFGFPSNFETISDFSAQLEQLVIYGLPDTYYADYVKNLQAVTGDAVMKAAATYIQPERSVVVVVGDRKVIEPGIRALNLGMVRSMSIQEALGE
jgi:zinc protease